MTHTGVYAPDPIRAIYDEAHKLAPELGLEFSGIVGDSNHGYGYHLARNTLPSSDYSVQLADDKMGDGWAASALDIKPKSAGMAIITNRLIHATEVHDPRIAVCVREFFGTVNGSSVTGRDVRTGRVVSADDSHLWHVHLSIIRRYANDAKALSGVAQVIAGVALTGGTTPPPVKPPAKLGPSHGRKWPAYMKPGNYFGLKSGPAVSHGGAYKQEIPDVTAIQAQLNFLGYSAGAMDGDFGGNTEAAVTRFQHAHMPGTKFYGQVWSDDWAKLMSL